MANLERENRKYDFCNFDIGDEDFLKMKEKLIFSLCKFIEIINKRVSPPD